MESFEVGRAEFEDRGQTWGVKVRRCHEVEDMESEEGC